MKISTKQIVQTIAPAVEPVSLAEMKAHLRIDSSDEDTLITAMIVAARTFIENRLHRSLVQRTYRADLWGFQTLLELPLVPISSITQIQYWSTDSPSVLTTLDGSIYTLNAGRGYIYLSYGSTVPSVDTRHDAVQITYVSGYEPSTDSPQDLAGNIPQAIRQAIYLLAADYYENRESTTQLKMQNLDTVDNLISAFREY